MAAREFSLDPKQTKPIDTAFRRIRTALPVPESLPLLQELREMEARSMRGQPPVVWREAENFAVRDGYGNQWLDWSSGVLITNAGHNHPRIKGAVREYVNSAAPFATYCFPNEPRARLVSKLHAISPDELDRVFLLSTGSEATEVGIKLARTYGIGKDPAKRYFVTFADGFHGRTYGAQLAGGGQGGGEWIDENPYFVQTPFLGSIETQNRGFDTFLETLKRHHIDPSNVAGVMSETFQGREAKLMPTDYAQALRQWCNVHDAALIFDEVQAGFGRTGKLFAFEHYGIVPDIICCGKGISSSLPIAAVIGSAKYVDQYGPGAMTSTHTGSPIPCVAALASIEAILDDGMIENSARVGAYLKEQVESITAPFSDRIEVGGQGLVLGMLFFDNREAREPDAEAAFEFCERCFHRGNLFFAPVGKGLGAVKFAPPLCITREAVEDGLYGPGGIKEALEAVMGARTAGVG